MAIIFFSPATNKQVGGIKVIYRQCELLSNNGIESYIYHPENTQFSCEWFSHNVKFWTSEIFNHQTDFLIIPEVWANFFGNRCIKAGLHYAIYVQNGYSVNSFKGLSDEELYVAYDKADLILAISEDTVATIKLAFPAIQKNKIHRIFHSVNALFEKSIKQPLITYMPRKLPIHTEQICFLLKPHLPSNWRMNPINNKTEEEVAAILSESSIFLSFCEMEGCPLPPIEAAFSGNIVVGYTGEGAKEYFLKPAFREVNNGDFINYIKAILNAIDDCQSGLTNSYAFLQQIEMLRHTHSQENELFYLMETVDRIQTIMKRYTI